MMAAALTQHGARPGAPCPPPAAPPGAPRRGASSGFSHNKTTRLRRGGHFVGWVAALKHNCCELPTASRLAICKTQAAKGPSLGRQLPHFGFTSRPHFSPSLQPTDSRYEGFYSAFQ